MSQSKGLQRFFVAILKLLCKNSLSVLEVSPLLSSVLCTTLKDISVEDCRKPPVSFSLFHDTPVKKPLQNVKGTKYSFPSGTHRVKVAVSEWQSGPRGKQWESLFPLNKFAIDTSVFAPSMAVCTPAESHKHVSVSRVTTPQINKREPCGNTEWGDAVCFLTRKRGACTVKTC